MKNPKFFTKLDASNGYWHILFDKESSKLLTFNSLFGQYSFYRLIEAIEGTKNSQDDILIWSETLDDHIVKLKKVSSKLRENGQKLNRTKCEFAKTQITHQGHLISHNGIEPDPNKIKAKS